MSESTKITVEGNSSIENAIKVAFASNDMQKINSHFGGAKEFCVYRVSKDGFELEGIVKTDTSDLEGDDKTDFKIKALDGVNIMYCESIGPTAAAKVIRSGMHPMKDEQERKIEDVLKELVFMINANPPPWIKKIIHVQNSQDIRLARWAK
ncbi:MAG: nitrogen fixation protein NifX [Sulfurimonas sp. RIFOXYD12_FULL_33_39]|uniref:nitrogen fixation protein NifX n=1 Tax=unclassified Sulfurimonas TaxID=2623549 RepID=UPI0008CAFCDE|nr:MULTISPECIES: nitrogen fixation protein NifX [unclassified Sulfurimonas]OHE10892.1 MAG: nitrogen fixation protein NifX [Sulfurimonas sp. RIFOXYD12_FULL_33_39]OHE13338.1 MAG: nitrogen fixation protein NifX [Sulfurimonas sp. RIFOXYD2_FULL_34_21]DAB28502.1 MAG TPA: nitrogen fixation protein NifX [Sulfurimonas sp. UBA10385]